MVSHPLDGARTRIKRAGVHVDELKGAIRIFGEQQSDRIALDYDAQTQMLGVKFLRPADPPPDALAVLTGEVCYNLRAALDYLVYELAQVDSGQVQEGTQFPIEDDLDYFRKRRVSTMLRGVNPAHVTAIERLQPGAGCQWTGELRDVSNPDKHKRMAVLEHNAAQMLRVTKLVDDARGLPLEEAMKVEFEFASQIAFEDGFAIVPTLERLKEQVSATVQAFDGEFQRRP